jgi:hypothetical protein
MHLDVERIQVGLLNLLDHQELMEAPNRTNGNADVGVFCGMQDS